MNRSDAYYRALVAYRKQLAGRRDCARDTRAFAEAGGSEKITVTRMVCTVDEEWIRAIETGLIHIEKAIREERQFIYSNGEVIPIERVKTVSRDSVEHLARHAELITRVEEGKDLIPDQLYTVERLSDYAVYENRFLYMLLCYLRDFVTLRYQKILELTNRYAGKLEMERQVCAGGREVFCKIDLQETRQDDPYLWEHNTARLLIDRMDLILKTVLAFLATPLMESAGKAALLKPPITKTNVLKMDNNFKGAVALYDYIIAYDGDGYTVSEDTREIQPFGTELSEDMAEVEILLAQLVYQYGLELTPELKAAMEHDESECRLAELRQRTEQLIALERKLEREGVSATDYMVQLEQHVRALQNEADRNEALYAEINAQKQTARDMTATIAVLTDRVESFDQDRRQLELNHTEELHEAELRQRREQNNLLEAQAAEKAIWAERAEAERNRYGQDIAALKKELDDLSAAYDRMAEEKRLLEARVLGQRALNGEITSADMENMTDKESFDELERQLDAFVRLYEKVWSKTKRKIRKDLLNLKHIKGQSGKL
jgi:hypothetical protein